MKWIKKGLILSQAASRTHGLTNTQVPFAVELDGKIRVFFGAREKSGGPADIHFMDVDPNNPADILHFQKTPVLSRGTTGCFDQDGVLRVCVKKADDRYFLYYGGFSKL
ncbi:MAG: hypothetical protein AB7O48_19775, partial [Cyclobacteriaceae bacterium]